MERGQVEAGGGTIKPTKFRLEDIDKARERDYHHVRNRNLDVLPFFCPLIIAPPSLTQCLTQNVTPSGCQAASLGSFSLLRIFGFI